MKSFIITDLRTNKTYTVLGPDNMTIYDIWEDQKRWFITGARVKVMDERGRGTTFIKKKRASQPY